MEYPVEDSQQSTVRTGEYSVVYIRVGANRVEQTRVRRVD